MGSQGACWAHKGRVGPGGTAAFETKHLSVLAWTMAVADVRGHPALLAVDCKTDIKVVLKFVPDMVEYHRQVAMHKELKGEPLSRLVDSYAALRPGQVLARGRDGELQRGWGLPCLVLEYGECSLADTMSRGVLPPVELKATFEAMLRAVLALHARGYAHAALQPESLHHCARQPRSGSLLVYVLYTATACSFGSGSKPLPICQIPRGVVSCGSAAGIFGWKRPSQPGRSKLEPAATTTAGTHILTASSWSSGHMALTHVFATSSMVRPWQVPGPSGPSPRREERIKRVAAPSRPSPWQRKRVAAPSRPSPRH